MLSSFRASRAEGTHNAERGYKEFCMITLPSMKEFLEAGVHFGHTVGRWHPKSAWYIHSERGGVHIINIEKTVEKLQEYLPIVSEHVAQGKAVLFVGTKKQAADIVKQYAESCGMPYTTTRWLGGLLTNFDTMKQMLDRYRTMMSEKESGKWEKYTKKERTMFEKELEKKHILLYGLRNVRHAPEMLCIIDVRKEKTALREAQKRNVPVVALADTNINPDHITYPIPGNDDAVKSIELFCRVICEAIQEGLKRRETKAGETVPAEAPQTGAREIIAASM